MGMFDAMMGYTPGMTEEEKAQMKAMSLMGLGSALAQASAPTTDPSGGSLGRVLGGGLQGLMQGRQMGMGNIQQGRQMAQQRAEQQRAEALRQGIAGIPTTEQTQQPIAGSLGGLAGAYAGPMQEHLQATAQTPRSMGDMALDHARIRMEHGDIGGAANAIKIAQSMEGETPGLIKSPQMYQTDKGEYRWGFFTEQGNLAKDIRAATDKETKATPAVAINMGKPAAASERTALSETQESLDSLDKIESLFDEAFVGPFAGREGSVKDVIGETPFFAGNTARQSEFYATEQAMKNAMIKAITGAQMSEPEAKRIMSQLPHRNNPPSVFRARLKATRENFKTIKKRREEVLRKSGLRVPELEESQTVDFTYIPGQGLQ
jgi:hypothetical protein